MWKGCALSEAEGLWDAGCGMAGAGQLLLGGHLLLPGSGKGRDSRGARAEGVLGTPPLSRPLALESWQFQGTGPPGAGISVARALG